MLWQDVNALLSLLVVWIKISNFMTGLSLFILARSDLVTGSTLKFSIDDSIFNHLFDSKYTSNLCFKGL